MNTFENNSQIVDKKITDAAYKNIAQIQKEEYFHTLFGPECIYFIKKEKKKLYLYVYDSFTKKLKEKHDISTKEKFHGFFVLNPMHYSNKVLNGHFVNFDNYIKFINSFKKETVTKLVLNDSTYSLQN